MRIAIVTIGTRGDVQPYIALAQGLQKAGHHVKIVTQIDYEGFITEHGVAFAPLHVSTHDVLQSESGTSWLETGSNPITFIQRFREIAGKHLETVAHDTLNACRDVDAILSSTLGLFSSMNVADHLNIPLIPVALQPLQRSTELAYLMAPPYPQGLPFKALYHQFTYWFGQNLMWWAFGREMNRQRRDIFDLPPITVADWTPDHIPYIYGFSEYTIPKPHDWGKNAIISGYWFLDAPEHFTPPADLRAFLDAGSPPVYVGFGSMNTRDPHNTTRIVIDALMQSGQRGIIARGWGGMTDLDLPETIHQIDAIPHDWLFPRMAAVVHHGGLGTTAAGFRAGVPSIIIPFFADQPFWGQRVQQLGVGPQPIPRGKLTAEKLANAIRQAVTDAEMRQRAATLGENLRQENGVANAVHAIEAYLADKDVFKE